MKTLRPMLFIVSLVLVVGLACAGLTGAPTQQQPPTQSPPTQVNNPTEVPPQPTEVPPTEAPATSVATEPPAPASQPFFTEEFDQDPGSDWVVDVIAGKDSTDKENYKTDFTNSRMRIEIPEKELYFYYTYTGYTYDNVRLDLRADNRGVNTNNVSLTCRGSKDGWYEWSVGSDGVWYLYAVTDKYNLIANGGTKLLKQGKEVNEYGLECKDKKIGMFINGQEIKNSPVTDNKYGLREGTVGFNVSSLNITPVVVEIDWFKISQP